MRTKKRAEQFGEVFTPIRIVHQMLDMWPCTYWSDATQTIGDITGCGNGNFLVEIIKRKIEAGLTPTQALNTTFGIDIMQDNIDECRERLLKQAEESSNEERNEQWVKIVEHNIICGDALTFDWDAFEPLEFKED